MYSDFMIISIVLFILLMPLFIYIRYKIKVEYKARFYLAVKKRMQEIEKEK